LTTDWEVGYITTKKKTHETVDLLQDSFGAYIFIDSNMLIAGDNISFVSFFLAEYSWMMKEVDKRVWNMLLVNNRDGTSSRVLPESGIK